MSSDYILTSDGVFVSQDELRHTWFKKGEAAENHKYIRREWKNGRWRYYYDDGTVTDGRPKGQNYTVKNSSTNSSASSQKTTNKSKSTTRDTINNAAKSADKVLNSLIGKGQNALNKIDFVFSKRVKDLFD